MRCLVNCIIVEVTRTLALAYTHIYKVPQYFLTRDNVAVGAGLVTGDEVEHDHVAGPAHAVDPGHGVDLVADPLKRMMPARPALFLDSKN